MDKDETRDNRSAQTEQEIYFLLARAVLLGMHVCIQIGPTRARGP